MSQNKTNINENMACPYYYWHNEISHETCQRLICLGKENWKYATVGTNLEIDRSIRKSDVVWVHEQWVYDLIWPYMQDANKFGGWKYNISAAQELQLTRYAKGGFYKWHKDGTGSHREIYVGDNKFLHGNTRKLSMTIVLNDEYEGGDFQIRGDYNITKVPKLGRGSIIIFPSFMDHRVTPITKGIRYSLIAWFVGPPFV
tara:strand:+ start:561 stop:1160 length:600 start_codon:yes stop_codon:yes gene_type:complete